MACSASLESLEGAAIAAGGSSHELRWRDKLAWGLLQLRFIVFFGRPSWP